MFCEKQVVLENFTKFTRNTFARVSFLINLQTKTCNFIKIESLSQVFSYEFCDCNFIKKETLAQVLYCEFREIFKTTFSREHIWATGSTSSHN